MLHNWFRSVFSLASRLGRHKNAAGTVVSFPKSGRTWLRVMLDELKIPMHYTHAGSQHSLAADLPELRIDSEDLKGVALLFLHRDPRDTVVSGYFQKTLRLGGGSEITMSDFLRDSRSGLEKVVAFNLLWLEGGNGLRNFRSVRYEDLRADTVNGLRLIVKHLQPSRKVSSDQIVSVVEQCSFQRMREREKNGELAKRYGAILVPTAADNPDSFKVRRGKVGGYVHYFSELDMHWSQDVLERHDYFKRVARASEVSGLLSRRD